MTEGALELDLLDLQTMGEGPAGVSTYGQGKISAAGGLP